MDNGTPSTHQKALQINLDAAKYGAFAEIGAGQEVARWFFHVGGAAGTVAKTISAYDMTVSDAIYGPSARYVSHERLQAMLEYEFDLLRQRLDPKWGATKTFFVFANTVATRSYSRHEDGHGWMGIRFQHERRADPSTIILHVRLFDLDPAHEQEALGVLGVNLVWGAYHQRANPPTLIHGLLDNLTRGRVEIDLIRFSGPAFAGVDNRLMSLQLVEQGFTEAAMFTAAGEVVQPADVLYKQPILIERGSFRPITNLTHALVENARQQFRTTTPPVVVMEMTLRNLQAGDRIDHSDFLARVDTLGALGRPVMISNYLRYHRLAPFLRRLTGERIGFAMGVRNLREVFDETFYPDLPGGLLQAMGQLFQGDVRLYVCPAVDPATGKSVSPRDFQPAPAHRHLYEHLWENGCIQTVPMDEALLRSYARDIRARIQTGDAGWEKDVPAPVAELIRSRHLFGHSGTKQPTRTD